MSIELAQRALAKEGDDNLRRRLELSAYFTIPKLEPRHRELALFAAMLFANKEENLASALSFANRLLANGGGAKKLERVSSPFFISIPCYTGLLSPPSPPLLPHQFHQL